MYQKQSQNRPKVKQISQQNRRKVWHENEQEIDKKLLERGRKMTKNHLILLLKFKVGRHKPVIPHVRKMLSPIFYVSNVRQQKTLKEDLNPFVRENIYPHFQHGHQRDVIKALFTFQIIGILAPESLFDPSPQGQQKDFIVYF